MAAKQQAPQISPHENCRRLLRRKYQQRPEMFRALQLPKGLRANPRVASLLEDLHEQANALALNRASDETQLRLLFAFILEPSRRFGGGLPFSRFLGVGVQLLLPEKRVLLLDKSRTRGVAGDEEFLAASAEAARSGREQEVPGVADALVLEIQRQLAVLKFSRNLHQQLLLAVAFRRRSRRILPVLLKLQKPQLFPLRLSKTTGVHLGSQGSHHAAGPRTAQNPDMPKLAQPFLLQSHLWL